MSNPAILLIIVMLGLILFGIGLIALARYSRKKNLELASSDVDSELQVVKSYLRDREYKKAATYHYSSSVPKAYAIFGKILAIGAIGFVMAFLLFVLYVLIFRY